YGFLDKHSRKPYASLVPINCFGKNGSSTRTTAVVPAFKKTKFEKTQCASQSREPITSAPWVVRLVTETINSSPKPHCRAHKSSKHSSASAKPKPYVKSMTIARERLT